MNLFIPITKVDEQRREVWGVAAEEAPDKTGEIMDYALSKPRFEEWSKTISDATQGKSLGNVRAMHQPIAAGKVIDMQFDETAKKVYVGARIIDDAEWKKVTEGVYTGFSVGGRYGEQRYENGLLRYEAIPTEISIVDNPCMRGATFTMVKADGAEEQHAFAASVTTLEANKAVASITLDGHPVGTHTLTTNANNVYTVADPQPMAYIHGLLQQHVAALSKAGARHSASDQKLVQAIHDSACSLGAGCADMGKHDTGGLKKDVDDEPAWIAWAAGMDVQDLASALAFVSGLTSRLSGDNADVASKLSAAAQLITSALNDKVAEQAAATQAAAVDAAQDEALETQIEAAATTSAGALANDEPAERPAAQPNADHPQGVAEGDMNKAQLDAFKIELVGDVKALLKEFTEVAAAPLRKAEMAGNDLAKRFDEVTARLGAFEGRIDKLEKLPAGSGPILREVGVASASGEDALIASLDQLIKDEDDPTVRQALMARRTQAAIKLSYRAGGHRIS